MKRNVLCLVLILGLVITLVGCKKSNAIVLEDGQTLKIVDNTLGEGKDNNARIEYEYKNSTTNEANGYVYLLPVSDFNPTIRYFAGIKQGDNALFVEITDLRDGAVVKENDLIDITDLWKQYLTIIDVEVENNPGTLANYTKAVTINKYSYAVSKNNNITVWGDKTIEVSVTCPMIINVPIKFKIEIEFLKLPLILTHEGDSWEVLG